MIICHIKGGLGNQMFQYATAKSIAIQNQDTFKLDIASYTSKTLRDYRLGDLSIEESIATPKEVRKLSGKGTLLSRVLNKIGITYRARTYYKDQTESCYDNGVFQKKNIYLDGYWQNEEYFKSIRPELLNDLKIKNIDQSIKNKYYDAIRNANSISIHIRRGDYLLHPKLGVLDPQYYLNAIEYITENVDDPVFYIFSDDLEWCNTFFSFIKKKVLVTSTTKDTEDMYLMSICKHNIIANSSFSWWSAWLNDNEQKIVVAPKKWRADSDHGVIKIVPNSWTKL